MSKEITLIIFGIILIVQTQFGIPDSWHTALVVFFGFMTILLGFFLRIDALSRLSGQSGRHISHHQTFVENTAFPTADQQGNDRKEKINSFS